MKANTLAKRVSTIHLMYTLHLFFLFTGLSKQRQVLLPRAVYVLGKLLYEFDGRSCDDATIRTSTLRWF